MPESRIARSKGGLSETLLSKSVRLAASPASAAYSQLVQIRAALYRKNVLKSRRLAGSVISVGNLTVGGTGKTPMVLWIAERLAAEGEQPAILTRGYHGGAQADASGVPLADEVALLRERLAGRAQLGIGKDRYRAGKILERHGVRWFILDDGFQHLALRRDADIVLLDASDAFGGGSLLPAGRLREPPSALGRADVVVITRVERAPELETEVRRFANAPIFCAQAELDAVLRAPAMNIALSAQRSRVRFYAFCGIGNPAAFFADLCRWGFNVVGQRSFPDHHRYSLGDVTELERSAIEAGAEALVCTEKDVFNLRGSLDTALPVYACRIRLVVYNERAFWNAVLETIARRRAASNA